MDIFYKHKYYNMTHNTCLSSNDHHFQLLYKNDIKFHIIYHFTS